jgi:hypothetical protein
VPSWLFSPSSTNRCFVGVYFRCIKQPLFNMLLSVSTDGVSVSPTPAEIKTGLLDVFDSAVRTAQNFRRVRCRALWFRYRTTNSVLFSFVSLFC